MSELGVSICRSWVYQYVGVGAGCINMSELGVSICRSWVYQHVGAECINMSELGVSICRNWVYQYERMDNVVKCVQSTQRLTCYSGSVFYSQMSSVVIGL